MTKAKQVDELDDTMRVLSNGTCDTLSGVNDHYYGAIPGSG